MDMYLQTRILYDIGGIHVKYLLNAYRMYIRKVQNCVRGVAKDVQFQECQNFIFDVHKIECITGYSHEREQQGQFCPPLYIIHTLNKQFWFRPRTDGQS
jgi:hypothetical protein